MKWSLPSFALRHPVTIIMVIVAVLAVGVISWTIIQKELMLTIDYMAIRCSIPYPNATPEQVEREVSIPAEGMFRTIPNLKRITATSHSNGCYISMYYEWGTDMSEALNEVRERVERLRLQMPAEVDRFYLSRSNSLTLAMMSFEIYREGDEVELAHWARTRLRPLLQRIPGVAEVEIAGSDATSVYVNFDPGALRSAGVALYDVVRRLQRANVDVWVGEFTEGSETFTARVECKVGTVEELSNLIVGPNSLRLRQVARIFHAGQGSAARHTIDGRRGVYVRLLKTSGANTIATCDAVKAELDRLKRESPMLEGANVFIFADQSREMLSVIDMMIKAGKNGAILALAILFIFMHRVRATLIVALAIPLSLVVSFVSIYFLGMTLNAVTLSSMVISIGLLVDNSIVVMENILRLNRLGRDPKISATQGAQEVGLAITTATLTTIVVFIPVFYMETGELAIYMREFSIPVTIALGASLLVSLTVIPLGASKLKLHAKEPRGSRFAERLPGFIGRPIGHVLGNVHPILGLINTYSAGMVWTLRHRLATMILVAALAAVTVAIPMKRVGRRTLPDVDWRRVIARVDLDQGYDSTTSHRLVAYVEDLLNAQREELGIKNILVQSGSRGGRVTAYLYRPEDLPPGAMPPFTTQEVSTILRRQLPEHLPGGEVNVETPRNPTGGGRTYSLRMRGEDILPLMEHAERFRDLVAKLPNVTGVHVDTDRKSTEVRLEIDEARASAAGITSLRVARSVDIALRGTDLFRMKQEGNEIQVRAAHHPDRTKTIEDLDNVPIPNDAGQLVPLGLLVHRTKADTPRVIQREDGRNVVQLTAEISSDDTGAFKEELDGLIAAFHLPKGYSIDTGERLNELEKSTQSFAMALTLAIVLIYIVMGALFESFLLPLSILTSVPLAFIGVYWSMYLTGSIMDIISLIGAILMCGVVVNNGIVLVDHINQLRLKGLGRFEAIIQAGRDRFRPVMMTALTTILGCIPLAVGSSVGDMDFKSLGRTLIGGLTTGTLLTLLVVPLFYSFIDDMRGWLGSFFSDVAKMLGRTPA